jgi:membrane-bound serine protease (ClpP class)
MIIPMVLSLVGILAILAEFFIPSAGLIGLGGLGAIIVSIVMVFRDSGSLYGFIFLFANLIIVPAIIIAYWKHFPRSFMGRRLILSPGAPTEEKDSAEEQPSLEVGTEGVALTFLRPAGTGMFGERRISIQTDGEYLDKDSPIRIIRIEGNRVFVEAAGPAENTNMQKEQQT